LLYLGNVGACRQAHQATSQAWLDGLRRDDGLEWALDRADHAAVAAVYVDEGRLVPVNTHDGFDLAYLLRHTEPAGMTTVMVDVERGLTQSSAYQNSIPFRNQVVPQKPGF
jgi:hypothetical protein